MTAKPADLAVKVMVWIAAVGFSLVSLAMVSVAVGGVKDSELLVVSLYMSSCAGAALFSILALAVSMRWAKWVCIAALAASSSVYALEADLRSDENAGAAFVLITIPLLIAALLAAALVRARRRAARGRVPKAKIHSRAQQ